MKWFICSLFLGRHYQLWKKYGFMAFNREGRLTQNSVQRGVSIRYGAFIGSWAFIRSFTVCLPRECGSGVGVSECR